MCERGDGQASGGSARQSARLSDRGSSRMHDGECGRVVGVETEGVDSDMGGKMERNEREKWGTVSRLEDRKDFAGTAF